MVDIDVVRCDLCGAVARHVVTKEFDGEVKNFCCRGCLGVYELMREEGLSPEAAEGKFFNGKGVKNPKELT